MEDRELDVEIAEKVMQWKRVHSDRDAGDDRKDVAWLLHYRDGVLKGEPYSHPSMNGLYDRTFHKWWPSTDISAAMEVLDKADGLWTITRYPYRLDSADEDTPFERKYSCTLRFGDSIGSATADTAPRAICEASLAAIETK